jgi:hypothetical protein
VERRRTALVMATLGGAGIAALATVALWAATWTDTTVAPQALGVAVEGLAVVAVVASGAVLLARGRELGVAVLTSVGVLTVPSLVLLVRWLIALGAAPSVVLVVAAPSTALVAAGGFAWAARRPDRWRWREEWSWPHLAASAGLLVGAWFPWVVEPLVEGGRVDARGVRLAPSLDLAAVDQLAPTVALGLLLAGSARLDRRLAAGLLLGVVAQTLPPALLAVHQALRGGAVVTTFGWLAVLSATTLAVLALWWRDADQRRQQQRCRSLADAAGLS